MGLIYGSSTLYDNIIQDNVLGVLFMETSIDASNDTFYNNFIDNATQVVASGTNNQFHPLPEEGNLLSDWVSPDNDGDGIVDLPYVIIDTYGVPWAQDNQPWTVNNGWIVNLAPVFTAIGPQEVVECDILTFMVEVIDPDGDNIVSFM